MYVYIYISSVQSFSHVTLFASKSSCLLCEKIYFWGSWKRRPVCLEFKIKQGNKWVGQSQKSYCVFWLLYLLLFKLCLHVCVYNLPACSSS